MSVEQRLQELGVNLPQAAAPAANYVSTIISGPFLYISGQIPFQADGTLYPPGKVGGEFSLEDGSAAAKLCAISILSQIRGSLGGFDRFVKMVKLTGFVNAVPEFKDHPVVINAASDFLVEVLGDAGKHTRSAVGAGSLPFGVPVEIEAIAEIES